MRFLQKVKDGGPLSHVHAYFLIEAKSFFSAAVLRFGDGSREAYHTHAFSAVSWVLKGKLTEHAASGPRFITEYLPSFRPIFTPRERFHKVLSTGTTWVITFRGPWRSRWLEYANGTLNTLTHGRRVIRLEHP